MVAVALVLHATSALFLSVTFTPLIDIHLDRHIEWGGYAGMTVRFVRTVEPELRNAQGETTWPETHRYRAPWTDYTWWLDGIPDPHNFQHWGGLTLMDHPTNRRHPTPWLTWTEKYIQGMNAAIIRDEPLDLKKGEIERLDMTTHPVEFEMYYSL